MDFLHKLFFSFIILYQMEKSKKFEILNLIALSLLVLVLIAVSSLSAKTYQEKNSLLKHWESEASLHGIIEMWNIDTFSGGSVSKTDYLNTVARSFEKINNGLYVNIINMSVEEARLALADGRKPMMISFGYGVGQLFLELFEPLNINCTKVKEEIKISGQRDSVQYAIGYLMGGYAYYSTTNKLLDASKDTATQISSGYESCGYDKALRKTTKHIYGLCVGDSEYISPMSVLSNKSSDEIFKSSNDYDAYVDFISLNKATILLGTQRDLVKLKGKLERGAIEDLIIEPAINYNDLIQYIGIVKGQDEMYANCCKMFVEHLMSEASQKKLEGSGMFSTTISKLYSDEDFSRLEEAVWNIENVPNVF